MYGGSTSRYQVPYPIDGDKLSGAVEKIRATMAENLARAAILGVGGSQVYAEGSYARSTNSDGSSRVTLSGAPALLGLARGGLVEVKSSLVWPSIAPGVLYYLYAQANPDSYVNPASVATVASQSQLKGDAYILLATLDLTNPAAPVLNTSPAGKPVASSLLAFLSQATNPFGVLLTQAQLVITDRLWVNLAVNQSVSIAQSNAASTQPAVKVSSAGTQPEILGAVELRLGDSRLPAGVSLTEAAYPSFPGGAKSFTRALAHASSSPVVVLSVASTQILTDASLSSSFSVLLTASLTLALPTNGVDGQRIRWRLIQDATGGHTLTLAAGFVLGFTLSSVTLSTAPRATDYLEATYRGDTFQWDVTSFVSGF